MANAQKRLIFCMVFMSMRRLLKKVKTVLQLQPTSGLEKMMDGLTKFLKVFPPNHNMAQRAFVNPNPNDTTAQPLELCLVRLMMEAMRRMAILPTPLSTAV